ncbi:hypothetical protein [Neorhizobium sp. DAR64872/K0K18]|uniref:hypothetical protein n=1 Tax=Neorhizobium sp. DAR64872/K0K18 TaxID=3421958 RepID=UPI003D2789D2
MIKPLTLSQRLLERADASDEDCRTDDGDIMRAADEALKAKDAALARLEDERAEQWRKRRDAEASRDVEKAVSDSLRKERDKLTVAMEGIVHFSDALNFRNDHLSTALAQWIAEGASALKEKADA